MALNTEWRQDLQLRRRAGSDIGFEHAATQSHRNVMVVLRINPQRRNSCGTAKDTGVLHQTIRAANPIRTGRSVATCEIQNADDDAGRIVRRRCRHRKASSRMTQQQDPTGVYPRFTAKRGDSAGDVLSRYSPDSKIIPIVARSRETFGKLSLRTTKATAHDRYGRVTTPRKCHGRTDELGRWLVSHRGTKGLTNGARRAVNQYEGVAGRRDQRNEVVEGVCALDDVDAIGGHDGARNR